MKKVVIDLETRSECDLKKCGVAQYVRHPSTEVICVGYKIKIKKKTIAKGLWWPMEKEPIPLELLRALEDDSYTLVAHNVPFEINVFEHVIRKRYDMFIPHLPISRWRCTAAKAAAHALPRSLDGAGQAIDLPIQKDKEGHKLMLKMSKPRPTWVKKGTGDKYFWTEDGAKRLGEYCMIDVEAEDLLDDALPHLIEEEVRVWHLDHEINSRGIEVDLPLIKKIIKLIKENNIKLHDEFRKLTGGKVSSPAQVAETLALLNDDFDVYLPNMKAETVREVLAADLSGDEPIDPTARRILELRQALSKTSTAKYKAFLLRTNPKDFKLRDILKYWGASTGRWAGEGVQLQNLPSKVKISNAELAISVLELEDIELLTLCYRDNMEVFSSVIRSMLTASPGYELFAGDFAAIEARVLFWVAEHVVGLKLFESGKDIYVLEAAGIYGKEAPNITKGERALGKVAILGLGFGMGEKKALDTAHDWGVKDATPEIASKMVKNYRKKHKPVVDLWANIEKAAIAATLNPGEEFYINKVTWHYDGRFLYCKLPSGRSLAYYKPEVRKGKTPWGDVRPVLYHWGVHPKTKKWVCDKTYGGRLVENIVQAIARDLMVYSMFSVKSAGYIPLLTVHDEVVSEIKKGKGNVEEFTKLMSRVPKWAKGCPVTVEAWSGPRYKK